MPRENYRVDLPRAGRWREILNSDAQVYGGCGQGNLGKILAAPGSFGAFPACAEILPAAARHSVLRILSMS